MFNYDFDYLKNEKKCYSFNQMICMYLSMFDMMR